MHTGSGSPGRVRFGLSGLTSVQYRKLLRQSPVPGTTTPEPNGLPRLCVTQTRLPSRSPIENDVVWCSPAAVAGSHCSVGPARAAPSLTRARSRAAPEALHPAERLQVGV